MKLLVIYKSQTGFTKRYAEGLAERLRGQALPLEEAKQKEMTFFDSFDGLVYGGWLMAGKVRGADWFTRQILSWKEKKLALFMVGASPEKSEELQAVLANVLNEEEKQYAKAFYCPGGLNYEKMSLPSKLVMRIFTMIMKRKNTEAGELLSKSYDISDPKYLDPIVQYLQEDK